MGMCSALYTVECTLVRVIWSGYVPHYIPVGDMFRIILDILLLFKRIKTLIQKMEIKVLCI